MRLRRQALAQSRDRLALALSLFGRSYYIVLLAGGERRSRQRRLRDRILHPLVSFGNGLVAAVFFTGLMPAILQELKMLFG